MALLPLLSLRSTTALYGKSTEESSPSEVSGRADQNSFIILDTSDGSLITVPDREFLYGALSYEMSPGFESEALKAQAVACYTYFSRLRKIHRLSPDPELKGADFSADLSCGQFYLSNSQLKKKWGSLYEKSIRKIRSACDSVYGQVLTDGSGELIDAAYHAVSSGATENAADVFGIDNPHLKSAASPGDVYAPDQITDVSFTADEFRDRLKKADSSIRFSGKPENYIKSTECTDAGTVKKLVVCSSSFTGGQIRTAFELRSAAFTVEYADGFFTFTVRGWGHGVGMSQYGAQSMAQDGADYREILMHYYTDICIRKI